MQWGVKFHDGSVLHPWNGRTQEQRAREFMQQHRTDIMQKRGEIREIDQVTLVARNDSSKPCMEME